MKIFRREFIKSAGLGAAGLFLGGCAQLQPPRTRGGFRFVHLTDLHIQHELSADLGVMKCLKAVEALDPKPDFIQLGGDLVYDVFDQGEKRATMLYDLFRKTFADNTGLAVKHCMGNHDVFGWGLKEGVTPQHAEFGKKMYCDAFGVPKTYHSFDHKGWRFYVLDNIQPKPGNSYQSYLEEEQMAWLESGLASKPASMPAVVVSHIPILTVTIIRDSEPAFKDGAYHIPTGGMMRDAGKLTQLFAKHNVKLVLSGHIHELDRIEFRGVTYICDGAVCGGWWKGPNNDYVQEGFGILDLNPDGTFAHQYFDYGWEAKG